MASLLVPSLYEVDSDVIRGWAGDPDLVVVPASGLGLTVRYSAMGLGLTVLSCGGVGINSVVVPTSGLLARGVFRLAPP